MERFPALPHLRNRRGVSLVEILIVVVIIGMTAAFFAPKLDLAHYKIDGAMQAIGFTLMGAQREAVSQQHDVIVKFDATNRLLIIHDDNNNNRTVDSAERVRTTSLDNAVQFGRGSAAALSGLATTGISFVQTLNGLPALTFHRNGSASEDGGLYLTSSRALAGDASRLSDTRAVVVDRPTGRIEWWRYSGSTWAQGF